MNDYRTKPTGDFDLKTFTHVKDYDNTVELIVLWFDRNKKEILRRFCMWTIVAFITWYATTYAPIYSGVLIFIALFAGGFLLGCLMKSVCEITINKGGVK
jgi:hypothetical protein